MSDLDGDSHMHSSSSSDAADDSDAMFPSELDPPGHAPQNNLHPTASSLPRARHTPPQSQDLDYDMDMRASHDMTPDEDGMTIKTVPYTGYIQKPSPGEFAPGEKSDFAKSAEMAEPGASWNNRKAREEYQRATMQIEDKTFNLREFGDPFDESQQGQENGKENENEKEKEKGKGKQ